MIPGLPDTISPLELLWTVSGIIGFACNLWVYRFWSRHLALVKLAGANGRILHQLQTHLHEELVSTLVQLSAVIAGAALMTLPPANFDAPVTAGNFVVTAAFMFIETALVYKSVFKVVRWGNQRRMTMVARERHTDRRLPGG